MEILVANKNDYINYCKAELKSLELSKLTNQKEYIIYNVQIGKNLKFFNSCINNLLARQYEKNNYIKLEEITKLNELISYLNEEQCNILNAYAEIKQYKIENLQEVKDVIENIDSYQIIDVHNFFEVGKQIVEQSNIFEVNEETKPFIDYYKLGEQYLMDSNIKSNFCSVGLLVDTREMLDNDLVEEKIKKDELLKVTITKKKDFEKETDYSEVTIHLPTDKEIINNKLKLIGLDYNNLSKEDTHITYCELLNWSNKDISNRFDLLIEKSLHNLYKKYEKTTPLKDIEILYEEIKKFDNISMSKFLAIAELKIDELYNFQDFIDCAKDIEKYNLLPDVKNYDDMGRYLVNETGHFDDVSVLDEYINYEKLAKDYTQKGYTYNGNFTKSGFLFNKEDLEFENKKENEEEFE